MENSKILFGSLVKIPNEVIQENDQEDYDDDDLDNFPVAND